MKTKTLALILISFTFLSACNDKTSSNGMGQTEVSGYSTASPIPTDSYPATPEMMYLTATVWDEEPRLPILLYHFFVPDDYANPEFTQIHLGEFRTHLETLYAAGYSLVNLENWIAGDMTAPPDRLPLALTIDDVFLSNQIELDESESPLPETGLGVLWQFYQEHPDFGFQVSLFANFGDKAYGVTGLEERKDKQARVVVWCLEHGAGVYNHTFSHIDLATSTAQEISEDLRRHDDYLRELLRLANREDLIPMLGNMLAVPFSWPSTTEGYEAFIIYTTPEGKPMQAVFGSAYFRTSSSMAAPFSSEFDPYNIRRFEVNQDALNFLAANGGDLPLAQECRLGPMEESLFNDPVTLIDQIERVIESGTCPTGFYVIGGKTFDARSIPVTFIYPAP